MVLDLKMFTFGRRSQHQYNLDIGSNTGNVDLQKRILGVLMFIEAISTGTVLTRSGLGVRLL